MPYLEAEREREGHHHHPPHQQVDLPHKVAQLLQSREGQYPQEDQISTSLSRGDSKAFDSDTSSQCIGNRDYAMGIRKHSDFVVLSPSIPQSTV